MPKGIFEDFQIRGDRFSGAPFGVDISREAATIGSNLRLSFDKISMWVGRALAKGAIQILRAAQPRVPYWPGGELGGKFQKASTGDLRESGRAVLYIGRVGREMVVGRGNKDGSITENLSGIGSTRWTQIKQIVASVEYTDIKALWAHEELKPFIPRPKPEWAKMIWFTRLEAAGPKYLESAMLENMNSIKQVVGKAVKEALKEFNKTAVKKGKHKWEADIITLK